MKKNKRLKSIWKSMNYRCSSKENSNYGGRGIRVCSSWKKSFLNFKGWALINGYTNELQIDRKNNDGNYSPSNCRWVTPVEQAANKRTTRIIAFNNKKYTTRQFARKLNLSQNCVNNRIKSGWAIKRIISTPEKKNNKRFKFKNKMLTLNEIAVKIGIKYDTLHQRIVTNGMSVDEAVTKKLRETYNFQGQELTLPVIAKKVSIHVETLRNRMKRKGMTIDEAVNYSRY